MSAYYSFAALAEKLSLPMGFANIWVRAMDNICSALKPIIRKELR